MNANTPKYVRFKRAEGERKDGKRERGEEEKLPKKHSK